MWWKTQIPWADERNERVQLNYIKAYVDFFDIGNKAARTIKTNSSRADHDDLYYHYGDAENEDDYTDDIHKVNAVICIN